MKKFKDFTIKKADQGFTGDKIKMSKILNKLITVLGYKIDDSQFEGKNKAKGKGMYLTLHIELAQEKHVIFTGSNSLMQDIRQVAPEDMPFTTTIVEENDRYQFT